VLALLSHLLPLETCKGEPVAACKKHRHHYFRKTEVLTGYKDRQYTLKRFCRLSPYAEPEPTDWCRGCHKFRHQIESSTTTDQPFEVKVFVLSKKAFKSILGKYGEQFGKQYLTCQHCHKPIVQGQKLLKVIKLKKNYHFNCYSMDIPTLTVE
jgi:hypothetical protein